MNNSEFSENKVNRYQNSRIYKLVDDVQQHFYIGSTCCSSLAKRKSWHISASKQKPHIKVYQYFNSVGWNHVKIVLIQELKLDNKEQLLKAENEVISQNFNDPKCLNSNHSVLDVEHQKLYNIEYSKSKYARKREEIIEHQKIYCNKNVNKIKDYREKTKEHRHQRYVDNIEKNREIRRNYYYANKEELLKQQQDYRNKNKQKIKDYFNRNKVVISKNRTQKIQCPCGSTISKGDKQKHFRTKKHQAFIHDEKQTAETI